LSWTICLPAVEAQFLRKQPFIFGDVGDTSLLLQIIEAHKIDAILHFAAKIVVPESIADPLAYYLNNTAKTRALLEAAVKGKVRYFVSLQRQLSMVIQIERR
jgi:UDP-glucose 4-epimerase